MPSFPNSPREGKGDSGKNNEETASEIELEGAKTIQRKIFVWISSKVISQWAFKVRSVHVLRFINKIIFMKSAEFSFIVLLNYRII